MHKGSVRWGAERQTKSEILGDTFWDSQDLPDLQSAQNGPHPLYGWDFPEVPEKFLKDAGNALRAFPGMSLESTAGIPQAL